LITDVYKSCLLPCVLIRIGHRCTRKKTHDTILEDGHQSVHRWRESHATPRSWSANCIARTLYRKDKALAETAALLVMRGKRAAVFRDGEDA
jgi:hypothetical protein